MADKFKQRACIKFCVKFYKLDTETIEMLRAAFQEHLLIQYRFLNCMLVSRPVECHLKTIIIQDPQEKRPENVEKIYKVTHEDYRQIINELCVALLELFMGPAKNIWLQI